MMGRREQSLSRRERFYPVRTVSRSERTRL